MTNENVTPVRTSDPYGDGYPKEKIRYSKERTREKNIKGLPKLGDTIILPKTNAIASKSN